MTQLCWVFFVFKIHNIKAEPTVFFLFIFLFNKFLLLFLLSGSIYGVTTILPKCQLSLLYQIYIDTSVVSKLSLKTFAIRHRNISFEIIVWRSLWRTGWTFMGS